MGRTDESLTRSRMIVLARVIAIMLATSAWAVWWTFAMANKAYSGTPRYAPYERWEGLAHIALLLGIAAAFWSFNGWIADWIEARGKTVAVGLGVMAAMIAALVVPLVLYVVALILYIAAALIVTGGVK